MSNIVLNDDDIKHFVKFLKQIIITYGTNYIVNDYDLVNLPYSQLIAINKMKAKFGPDYIKKINQVLHDYIKMKDYPILPNSYQSNNVYNVPLYREYRDPIYTVDKEIVISSIKPEDLIVNPSTSIIYPSVSQQKMNFHPIESNPIDLKSISIDEFMQSCRTCKNLKSAINISDAKATELDLLAKNCKMCEDVITKLNSSLSGGNVADTEKIRNIFIKSDGNKENNNDIIDDLSLNFM